MRFLLVGCVRDCESVIKEEILRIRAAFMQFGKISYFLVESDSRDNSIKVLSELSSVLEGFQFLSLGNLQDTIPDRHRRMTHCRNAYVDFIRNLPSEELPDYVVVADLDGMNRELTSAAVGTCFVREDWDACMANQSRNYYDVYALRHPTWCPRDPWKNMWKLRELGIGDLKAREEAIHKIQRRVDTKGDWIQVHSAFGGLAIYKTELFFLSQYSCEGEIDEFTICEHVPFHLKLTNLGKKLFINPALVNSSWNEHNSIHKFRFRMARKIALFVRSVISFVDN